ncbi:peptidoglycan-binding protein [Streptomyces sp. NPDC059224]|uniref:peptidoglycan-binding protein n=1 Tax=Streptomyces sp. NPDC059224 TaxID=3346775 RepID=UPI0036B1263E
MTVRHGWKESHRFDGGTDVGQWRPLAEDLEPSLRSLVVRLRELKDQMGVSTTTLAAKTAYSRSSWERYLNGRTLPPRQAVEAMSRASGCDAVHLFALWELAEHARSGGPRHPADDAEQQDDRRAPRRRRVAMFTVGVAVALAVVGAAIWGTLGIHPPSRQSDRNDRVSAAVKPSGLACHYTRRNGRLLAGHSDSEPLVLLNSGGEPVVEVQCLLKYHKHSPGRIDGLFGVHTETAVKDFQRADGAAVDGKVGPQTWALLRT